MVPTATVVVTAYRRPAMLEDAIRSALSQTLSDVQVVVVDDAGDPANAEVASSFGDPRVTYIRHETNQGVASGIRTGIGMALGEFVTLLNDDDALLEGTVEKAVGALREHPDAMVAYGMQRPCSKPGVPTGVDRHPSRLRQGLHRPMIRELAGIGGRFASGTTYRRAAVPAGQPSDRYRFSWDDGLLLEACRNGEAGIHLGQEVCWYREHTGQEISKRSRDFALGGLAVAEELLEHPLCADLRSSISRAYAPRLNRLCLIAILDGDPNAARRYARRSVSWHPGWKPLTLLALSAAPKTLREAIARWRT